MPTTNMLILLNEFFASEPTDPGLPRVSTVTSTSVSLEWDRYDVGSIPVNYSVTWSPAGGSSRSDINGISTTIGGLQSNTAYTFKLQVVNAYGVSTEQSTGTSTETSKNKRWELKDKGLKYYQAPLALKRRKERTTISWFVLTKILQTCIHCAQDCATINEKAWIVKSLAQTRIALTHG